MGYYITYFIKLTHLSWSLFLSRSLSLFCLIYIINISQYPTAIYNKYEMNIK